MATTTALSSPFSARVNRIEISSTIAMTAEAAKLRAKGIDLSDLGMGEPHFNTPRHIKDAGIAAIEQNFTKYTAVGGVPELRKAIVARHAADFKPVPTSRRPPSEMQITDCTASVLCGQMLIGLEWQSARQEA